MSVITKGKTFANGEQLTAGKLNQMLDAATFSSAAVDNTKTTLSGGAITIAPNAITSSEIQSSSSKTSGVTLNKFQHISTGKVLGRTTASEGSVEEVDIVGSSGVLLDEDDMSSNSATRGASQQSIKAYTDTQDTSTKNLTLGYNQTYSLATLTAGAANQNTGSRPIVVMFNLADNEGVKVSNDNVTYFTVYTQSADRGPCTIIVPPGAYYKATKSSGSITNQAVILS